jgi:pilus assembly protein CpaE
MAKDLIVSIKIDDVRIKESISEELKRISDIQVVQWHDSPGERGLTSVKSNPNIIIVNDVLESTEIFASLSDLSQDFPQAAIFVVSTDKRPKHIVEVMKAGVSEYLLAPVDPELLTKAIEEVRTKLATDGKMAKGKIYSFISSKGGLGSTVIAVNAAAALVKSKGGSVALCDMSFQSGDSSVLLDMVPPTSFIDICKNYHRLDVALLRGCLTRHRSGVDFLAAPPNPEQSEDIRADHIEKTFDLIKKLYDQIVVDCTSMYIDECTVEAFNASHKVFIVTDMSVPAIRNAARLFRSIQKHGLNPQKMEFVVNRYTKGGTLSIEEVEKTLGKKIYWLFPNDFDDIVSSINRGAPLVGFNPQAPFSKNVFDFSRHLLNPQASEAYRGIRGAFGKAI